MRFTAPWILIGCLISISFFSSIAPAAEEGTPLHWSGEKTLWKRKENRVELNGKASVHQVGETLVADKIILDMVKRTVDAYGNCVYIAAGTMIQGEEMHMNMDTRTGLVVGGRVSTEQFSLTGKEIRKLSSTRFHTKDANYTTCQDCPHSWTIHGEDVDLEMDGYAHMTNVRTSIRDAPILWLPYLVVPVKSQRQTGMLFPKWSISDGRFRFVVPFFLATSRSTDMTLGLGHYSGQGRRLEWEGRYVLSPFDTGKANFFYTRDRTFTPRPNRWALNLEQKHKIFLGIEERFRILESSDNLYPNVFSDIPGKGEAVLTSELMLSRSFKNASAYVKGSRYRNLLSANPKSFDGSTVQVMPRAYFTTNDRFWLGSPAAMGLTLDAQNFTRSAGAFDRDPLSDPLTPFVAGRDPIRKAARLSTTPSLYTTFKPFEVVSFVPSVQYRYFAYDFHGELPALSRGYLIFKNDLFSQVQKIYETENPQIPRVKHLIRPKLTYSFIPRETIHEPEHPFMRQIQFANDQGFGGYNFDNSDIVPLDESRNYNNYFLPQGNALNYGFTTQIVRRNGAVSSMMPSYTRNVEWSAGQSINFRELKRSVKSPDRQLPLSRVISNLTLEYAKWSSQSDYQYATYAPITRVKNRHLLDSNLAYSFYKNTIRNLYAVERSVSVAYHYNMLSDPGTSTTSLGFTWSLSDYVMPSMRSNYDFVKHRFSGVSGEIVFQSPAQCWKLATSASRSLCPEKGFCNTINFDMSLNLTGSGWGGISEAQSTVTTAK